MKITLYAKTAHSKEGKAFIRYITSMKNKEGKVISMSVRTPSDVPGFVQSKCPYIVEFNKEDANLQARRYTDKDGNEKVSYTLWLKAYKESDEKYVDHSLDNFE